MSNLVTGYCHCKNLSFEISTEYDPGSIQARACGCSFCRLHGALNWSDPRGKAIIRIKDKQQLQKYRFALGTADFYLCRLCGVYLGAVLSDDDGTWSTLNLRLSGLPFRKQPVNYSNENSADRIVRRKRAWTPTTIVIDT